VESRSEKFSSQTPLFVANHVNCIPTPSVKLEKGTLLDVFVNSDCVSKVGLWLNKRCFDLFLTFRPAIFNKRKICRRSQCYFL